MNGQQSIVEKIVFEAEENAKNIVLQAQNQADKILSEATAQNNQLNIQLLEKAKKDAKNIVSVKLKHTDLEIRRKSLAVRFVAIEQAFEKAKSKVLSLSDADYLQHIKAQLTAYASNNDQVVISSRDQKRLTADFFDSVAKQLGIKLTLAKQFGNFEGGIILKSKHWDCNLTIDSNFKVFREQYETVVSKILSGEDNG